MHQLTRSAGILFHPTSMHTEYGIGDLGPKAYKFVDFLKASHQRFWQILPFGPTGYADSPYQTISAFAGNPLLISPDIMEENKLITKNDIASIFTEESTSSEEPINYDWVRERKYKLFKIAYKKFNQSSSKLELKHLHDLFATFCEKEAFWLDDFVLYYKLKIDNNLKSWIDWKTEFKDKVENPLLLYIAMNKTDLTYYKFIQWIFFLQWSNLKKYANENGIEIIGDIPIYVAHDSVDVWINRDLFALNEDGTIKSQAGVPPDYFSQTGQLWGNPLYKWDLMKENNYAWFIQRIKKTLELVDWVRIDHFRGFEAYWKVGGKEETAINGKWVKGPDKDLFVKMIEKLGEVPIIAEDLGIITPEVEELRDEFNFPGMKVVQFAFGGDGKNPHLPHNFAENSISYTGTHDNPPTLSWFQNHALPEEKEKCMEYFNLSENQVPLGIVKGLYASIAKVIIVPMQDILEQGAETRINTPSKTEGNWQYKTDFSDRKEDLSQWLKKMMKLYNRG